MTIMQKIEKEIEKKSLKYGIMGTENCIVTIHLTNEEKAEFYELDLSSNYNWEFEGNELTIVYTKGELKC